MPSTVGLSGRQWDSTTGSGSKRATAKCAITGLQADRGQYHQIGFGADMDRMAHWAWGQGRWSMYHTFGWGLARETVGQSCKPGVET